MIAGVIWALIGYAACEVTGRGKLTTTVVTAIAGALGLGGGLLHGQAAVPVHPALLVGVGLVVVLVVAAVIVLLYRASQGSRTGRHKHGSAAIASTRYVRYTETRNEPKHSGKARPDRIRLNRAGE